MTITSVSDCGREPWAAARGEGPRSVDLRRAMVAGANCQQLGEAQSQAACRQRSISLLSMRTDVPRQRHQENQSVRILLRTTVLATAWLVSVLGIAQFSGKGGGANIGIGLLMFALLIVVAGVWGTADGARQEYARVAVTWVAVAVLMGLLVPVFTYLSEPGLSWRVLISDVVQVGPFIAALITAPALLGGLLGSISQRSRSDGPG